MRNRLILIFDRKLGQNLRESELRLCVVQARGPFIHIFNIFLVPDPSKAFIYTYINIGIYIKFFYL